MESYKEIPSKDYFVYADLLPFTDKEVSDISIIFKNCKLELRNNKTVIVACGRLPGDKFNVVKMNDEWFDVRFQSRSKFGHDKYWRCDQFNGLIDCFKMIYDEYLTIKESVITEIKPYKEIMSVEYYSIDGRPLEFDEKEFGDIKKFLIPWYRKINDLKVLFDNKGYGYNNHRIDICGKFYKGITQLEIKKLDDEWYYILCVEGRAHNRNFSRQFWKCDQFKGLIDCIEMICEKSTDVGIKKFNDFI